MERKLPASGGRDPAAFGENRRERSSASRIAAVKALEKLKRLDSGLAAAFEADVERRKTPR